MSTKGVVESTVGLTWTLVHHGHFSPKLSKSWSSLCTICVTHRTQWPLPPGWWMGIIQMFFVQNEVCLIICHRKSSGALYRIQCKSYVEKNPKWPTFVGQMSANSSRMQLLRHILLRQAMGDKRSWMSSASKLSRGKPSCGLWVFLTSDRESSNGLYASGVGMGSTERFWGWLKSPSVKSEQCDSPRVFPIWSSPLVDQCRPPAQLLVLRFLQQSSQQVEHWNLPLRRCLVGCEQLQCLWRGPPRTCVMAPAQLLELLD